MKNLLFSFVRKAHHESRAHSNAQRDDPVEMVEGLNPCSLLDRHAPIIGDGIVQCQDAQAHITFLKLKEKIWVSVFTERWGRPIRLQPRNPQLRTFEKGQGFPNPTEAVLESDP